jgi:ATP:ADP antiporter, AAA family
MFTAAEPAPITPATRLERWLAWLLRPFARVEPSEAIVALAMTASGFLLLTSYYLVKTAREPLILLHGGAELKQYAAAGQAMLLVGVVRAYSSMAARMGRRRLLVTVFLFFASNLVLFALLVRSGVSIGVPFFLWVGVFNMTAVSQFWTLAADVYTPEQGKRIFAVLGIGASVGAVTGSQIAQRLAPWGPAALMGAAAAGLVACAAAFGWVSVRATAHGTHVAPPDEPVKHDGVADLLLRNRYLLLIAALTLLLNWVRSNGDYILDRTLLAAAASAKLKGPSATVFITTFKANYFQWVSAAGLLLQLFVVSRIMGRAGVGVALLVLPAVAFGESGLYLIAPLLGVLTVAKVGESALEYSLQNTARQALFLDASRAEKYVGKTAIDTVVVRSGDALTALGILAASRASLRPQAFVVLNMVLTVIWVAVVFAIRAEHARRAAGRGDAPASDLRALEPSPAATPATARAS